MQQITLFVSMSRDVKYLATGQLIHSCFLFSFLLSLDIVSHWCSKNKMTINIGKTKYVLIHQSNSESTVVTKLSISNTLLSQVHVCEHLGVYIHDKLCVVHKK